MQRKTLLATAFAVLVAGSASFAIAQSAAPDAPPPAPKGAPAGKAPPMMERDGDRGGPGFGRPGLGGPGAAVISDLHALERLYLISGRAKELPTLYNDVLAKSQDPQVRTYVYHRLARAQAAPANPDQAIATLRKSLDENLAHEASQRADIEKMRGEWEQRRNQTRPTAAPAPASKP
ncbi:hypothetical protein [Dyella sp. ASV21]|jgi:hypothetical protein|uniref:hypothetical protein n=1 Tax=Dyella sp. ASV21 TaxID=2795114 RepID=UPI0018EE3DA8|nr:hypothetical protein [Dyella sp. ASV21]